MSSAAETFGPPEITGNIKSPDVKESSGITASRCHSGVLWTHNDSGNEAFLFAFNRAGEDLGEWVVADQVNRDWEDIAAWKDKNGRCFLYIGEIGDNKRIWAEHVVFRVPEPLILSAGAASGSSSLSSETIRYRYPDGNHDAEALMVHPASGDIFIMSKTDSRPSSVFRLSPDFGTGAVQMAEKVAEVSLPSVPNGLITGADISPDGRNLVVCDYSRAYEFRLPVQARDFGEIWKQRPQIIDLGRRKIGEAVCYSVDGSEIFATSEGRNSPVVSVRRGK